ALPARRAGLAPGCPERSCPERSGQPLALGLRRVEQPLLAGDRVLAQDVLLGPPVGEDVQDAPAADRQRIGDEAAVAAAPVGLGAGEGGAARPRERLEALEAGRELRRLHVVRVAPEG